MAETNQQKLERIFGAREKKEEVLTNQQKLENIFGIKSETKESPTTSNNNVTEDNKQKLFDFLTTPGETVRELASGFGEGVKESFSKRFGEVKQDFTSLAKGELDPVSFGIQTVGKGVFGLAGDVIAEGFALGGRIISELTPDEFEEEIKKVAKEKGSEILNTKVGKILLKALQTGVEEYSEAKQKHPLAADNLESILNIFSLTPAGLLRKQGARIASKETIAIIAPKLSDPAIASEIASGRGKFKGLFRRAVLEPSPTTIEIANSVEGVVKKSKNPFQNIKAINKEVNEIDTKNKSVVFKNNSTFTKKELRSKLDSLKEESRIIFGTDKTIENSYNAIAEELERIINLKTKNLSGLFESRKEFDKIIKRKFPNIFEKFGTDVVRTNAVRDMRIGVNEFIAEKLPVGNTFRDNLLRESNMLRAAKNISIKATDLIDTNAIGRVFNTVQNRIGQTGITIGAIGLFTLTNKILANSFLVGTLALGGSVFIGGKVITSKSFTNSLNLFLRTAQKQITEPEAQVITDFLDEFARNQVDTE